MSSKTGCSKEEQIIMFTSKQIDPLLTEQNNLQCLQNKWIDLATKIKHFSAERGWLNSYDELTLRLSLTSELGELATAVQWSQEHTKLNELSDDDKHSICEEIADLAIYAFHYYRTVFADNKPTFPNKKQST